MSATATPTTSRLDELPADQRAALSLLLRQRKNYAEVSALLGIDERAVRERAHAALEQLAPSGGRGLSDTSRLELGDYLLGQLSDRREREWALTLMRESPEANRWARELAGSLAMLDSEALPEIPPEPSAERPPWQRSSRRGGALLLGLIVAGVIVAIVLLTSGGGSHNKATSAGNKVKAGASGTPTLDNEIPLTARDPTSKSVGVVDIVSESSKTAFLIEARSMPSAKGFYYAIWLYNSPTSFEALTRTSSVTSKHTIGGIAALPSNAGSYRELLVTKETAERPTHPGPVVLAGPFSLHGTTTTTPTH